MVLLDVILNCCSNLPLPRTEDEEDFLTGEVSREWLMSAEVGDLVTSEVSADLCVSFKF